LINVININWTLNSTFCPGFQLAVSDKVTMTTNPDNSLDLCLATVAPGDAGQYTCTVTMETGTTLTTSTNLAVNGRIYFKMNFLKLELMFMQEKPDIRILFKIIDKSQQSFKRRLLIVVLLQTKNI